MNTVSRFVQVLSVEMGAFYEVEVVRQFKWAGSCNASKCQRKSNCTTVFASHGTPDNVFFDFWIRGLIGLLGLVSLDENSFVSHC